MSLRIRCPKCRRGMSGKHSLCKDCRASSSAETTVYVGESGERIEVTTDRPSRSSSTHHGEARYNYSSVGCYGEASSSSHDSAYYDTGYAGAYGDYPHSYYPDTQQGHDPLGATYVRPRVHPYSDRYEHVARDTQPGLPSHGRAHPGRVQYRHVSSENYQHQSSYAETQQTRGQESQVQYVYSGTEGPDGEIID